MERVPMMEEERTVGELTAEREGLYTCISVSCRLPEEGVFCAWAVGEKGELRVGVLEPLGGKGVISRRFSDRIIAPLGALLRGELRPVGETEEQTDWVPLKRPEDWFRTPWLCGQLRRLSHVQVVREKEGCRVAVPYDGKEPFPLTQLFCFARTARVNGQRCVIYAFDGAERPDFR